MNISYPAVSVDGSTLVNSGGVISIPAGGVGTTQLAAQAVTAAKLGAVADGTTLSGGAGAALQVAALGVGSAQLAAQAVTAAKIATAAVDGSTIAGGNGTALSIPSNGVGAAQIAANAVTKAKLTANLNAEFITGTNSGTASTGYSTLTSGTINGTEANVRTRCNVAGTFSNLYFKSVTNGNSSTYVLTLFVNGVASALTVTLTNPTAGTSGVDDTHSVAVAAGDLVSMEAKLTAGAQSVSPAWGIMFVPS